MNTEAETYVDWRDYYELTKPRVVMLIVFTAVVGMFLSVPGWPGVMPVVFGGAVTVSALVSVWVTRGQVQTSPWLWVGIVGIFACILLVAYNTPHAAPHGPPGKTTEVSFDGAGQST